MKTACITGVGRGIGHALAREFLNKGFRVVGTTTNGECDIQHDRLLVVALDLASPESVGRCAEQIQKTEAIDILINNAGVLLDEEETVLHPEKLRATLEVNLIGAADLTERLLSAVPSTGHIIFISSTAGSLERTGRLESHFPGHYPAYKISKAAVNMYMRTLAMRFSKTGPMVSSVHPGWVRTDMGGPEADLSPEEAASDIYTFAVSTPETGGFWYKGKRLPW